MRVTFDHLKFVDDDNYVIYQKTYVCCLYVLLINKYNYSFYK